MRVRYSRDKWSAFLQPRFIGEGIRDNDAPDDRYSIPGEGDVWLFNAGFRYDFTDQIGAQLNINNLSDELPPAASIATGNDFIYDNVGRFYRLSLQIRLEGVLQAGHGPACKHVTDLSSGFAALSPEAERDGQRKASYPQLVAILARRSRSVRNGFPLTRDR